MSVPDGLSALQGRRTAAAARRGRQMPPPRHPRRDPPARTPDEDAAPDEAAAAAKPATAPAVRPAGEERQGRSRRGGAGLRLGQFYLDPAADGWVREVRLTAMQRGEDITGSAVVRWAIARAAGALTPEQVVEELLSAEQRRSGPGRPRR